MLIVDLADPESPKIVATLPLKNSIVGPPINLDIDPIGIVALVSDSVDVAKDGDALKQVARQQDLRYRSQGQSAQTGGHGHRPASSRPD